MKKLMHVILIFQCILIFPYESFAQCELLDPGIELKSTAQSNGNCIVTIDLIFTVDKNNGNKFTYVHLWSPSDYHIINYNKAPDAADLGAVLGTLAIDTDGAVSLLATYSPDPTIIPLHNGVSISEQLISSGIYKITIENISLTVPGACSSLTSLKGDVWSTQAASANPNVHCTSLNFDLAVADPQIAGDINCHSPLGPRTYDLDITTTNPTPINVVYKLYLDDGVLAAGSRTFGPGDQLIYTSAPISISSGTPFSVQEQNYTYGIGEDTRSVWVEVSGASLPNVIIEELVPMCEPIMPVRLVRFGALPIDDQVGLSWSTAEESGSSYFGIERAGSDLEFISLQRIPAAHNANELLHYNYLDRFPLPGVNYYRLKQVDVDGSFEYSKIISVDFGSKTPVFELLGNPASATNICILLRNIDGSKLSLSSAGGKNISFSLTKITNTTFRLTPDVTLSPGVYILYLNEYGKRMSRKLLIQ